MTTPGRTRKSRLSLALLVGASVLLLLLIACGSASQPAEVAAPAGSAQQVEPIAPAAPAPVGSKPAVASAPASQPAQTSARFETRVETGVDAAPETTAKADNMTSQATITAPSLELKEPASAQEMVAPTVAPEPTPAVAQVEPTATPVPPEPTATSAPVAQEPLPDLGNRVGNRIPDFTLELVDGATVTSASLVEQGRPTFLFFFATT